MFKEINGSHYNLDSVFDVVASNGKYYAFLVNGTRLEISVTDYNMLISSLVKVGDHYINRKHILKVSPNNGNYTLQFTNGSQIGLSFDDYASLISEYDIDAFEWKTKISEYLYSCIYETLDYDFAEKFMNTKLNNYPKAMCTSVRKGGFYGRNLDWYYNNEASFIIRTTRSQGRYASIGVASGIKELTNDFANSNKTSALYKVLPFFMQDGINEKGVFCNINVVSAGDNGYTTGTTPNIEQKDRICGVMLVRYILDRFDTAQKAVEYIRDYVSVYGLASANMVEEFHFMVGDANNTYVLEFVNNKLKIISNFPNDVVAMTNFYLYGWNGQIKSKVMGDSDSDIEATGLTPHSMGLERYNIISSAYSGLSTKQDMVDLMTSDLAYTKSYKTTTSPFWYSEFNATYERFGDITIYSSQDDYQGVVAEAINRFNNRSREENNANYGTWQTSHSSIYDINNKKLTIYVQEEATGTTHSLEIPLFDWGE